MPESQPEPSSSASTASPATLSTPEPIQTDADMLFQLLKNVNEISFSDAARQLNLPVSLIEAWATFLEEERIVGVRYKLTTPYLVYIPPHATPQERRQQLATKTTIYMDQEPTEEESKGGKGPLSDEYVRKELEGLNEAMSHASEQISVGNFQLLQSGYRSAVSRLSALIERMKGIKGAESFYEQLKRELSAVLLLEEQSRKSLNARRFDEARQSYSSLRDSIGQLHQKVKKGYPAAVSPPEIPSGDLRELIGKAYEMLRNDNMEGAKRIYEQVRQRYYALPGEFEERRKEMETDMVKLNKDLAVRIEKLSLRELNDGMRKIRQLLEAAGKAIRNNDFYLAENIYHSLKHAFEGLPPGAVREKLELEQQILKLYESLGMRSKEASEQKISELGREIGTLLEELQASLSAGKIADAAERYAKIKKAYDRLPPGFLYEKLALQDRILKTYAQLSAAYRGFYAQSVKAKESEITGLLTQMDTEVAQGRLEAASRLYLQCKEAYRSIPEGFLKEKTLLQTKMLRSYEGFLARYDRVAKSEFQSKAALVEAALGTARKYLAAGDVDMASQYHADVTRKYNELPPGFLHKKLELRNRVLEFYRELMLKRDSPFLKKIEKGDKQNYEGLLHLLLEFHRQIERKEFDELKLTYAKMVHIYRKLPVYLPKEKPKLLDDLTSAYREVQLYEMAESALALSARDKAAALASVRGVRSLKAELEAAVPEDKVLFDRVSARIDAIEAGESRPHLPLMPSAPVQAVMVTTAEEASIKSRLVHGPVPLSPAPAFRGMLPQPPPPPPARSPVFGMPPISGSPEKSEPGGTTTALPASLPPPSPRESALHEVKGRIEQLKLLAQPAVRKPV